MSEDLKKAVDSRQKVVVSLSDDEVKQAMKDRKLSWWDKQKPVTKYAIMGGGFVVLGLAIYGIVKLVRK